MKFLIIAVSILTAIFIIFELLVNYGYHYLFIRRDNKKPEEYLKGEKLQNKLNKINIINEYLNKSKYEKIFINSFDDTKLCGIRIFNHNTNKYIILVHGWHQNKESILDRAIKFDELGYNTLTIDQRAAGESNGPINTFGLKESKDLIEWIKYLNSIVPNVQIVLYGVSMGGTSILMSLNSDLSNNVKCVIEDCGTSEFKKLIEKFYYDKLRIKKANFILKIYNFEMKKHFGFTLNDLNTLPYLKNNEIPLLVIHGDKDDFVPFYMSKEIYDANKGYKEYYVARNRKHLEAFLDENYFDYINNFINKFM